MINLTGRLPSFFAPRFAQEKSARSEAQTSGRKGLGLKSTADQLHQAWDDFQGQPKVRGKKRSVTSKARKYVKEWSAAVPEKKPEYNPQGVPQELVEERPISRMNDTERRNFDWLPASALSEKRLVEIFGSDGWKLKELADRRAELKVGDLTGLRHDPEGLMAVRDMLIQRPDLGMADLTKKGKDGKLMVDPSIQHHQSKKLLLNRHDVKPIELTRMGASFASWLRNPGLAHEAYLAALDLLATRRNVTPKECEGMLAAMIAAVGGADSAQTPLGGASVVDMFKAGASLLKKRPDITPTDVNNMARETGKLAGKEAGQEGPPMVAQAFRTGARALERSHTLQVNDVIGASKVVRKHFPGEDAKATADRVRGFEIGVNLMADNPGLKSQHLDSLLTRAKEQRPGLAGSKLLTAFEGINKGVANGSARLETLTDPGARRGGPGDVAIDRFGQTTATDQLPGQASRPPARGFQPRALTRRPQRGGRAGGGLLAGLAENFG